jgi:predicted N-acetyltransferase YhbS
MDLTIRQEAEKDYKAVFNLIEEAFRDAEYSDHREHFLVEKLRQSDSFVPDLSLVALLGNKLVGYILLSRIHIENKKNLFPSLALAPVCVLPEFQGRGIGGILIEFAHNRAKELGYSSVVLLGHAGYYPRFGYKRAEHFGIRLPFEVPSENCMAFELVKGALNDVNGLVKYDPAFYA